MKRTFIIAEAGVNHNGNVEIAKKMIDIAAEAGADAVKFQTFKAENVVSKNAPKADYQIARTGANESQYSMIKKLELNEQAHQKLITHCSERGIDFLSTPFDLASIDFLSRLGLKVFKIPSGDITNLPYLRKIGSLRKEVILSTGMADLSEIRDALAILVKFGTKLENITILHCNTEYPTPVEDVNLYAMLTIKNEFTGIQIGYSDHTLGIEIPIAAVAMGAKIIEKHFTLDRTMEGPDHRASLEPDELKTMIGAIRNIEQAMGDGIKRPSQSEQKNIQIGRRSIVASTFIRKGSVFSEQNLAVKRPGKGISPMRWDEIVGRIAQHDYNEDELIEF
jgi:N,N'-diacetyllegionaminate synthase